ncbi:hypothetical protein Vretimale_17091 [Volvox reticuliferus]|uniref:Tubulin/FtsZ GTPase domain-containing protein n=2 Tax=Volvox reticuliferus TaxID=1737510 RepID=A0A8J4CXI4_9CHLO|nr:hypothetical protein Vretifemale_18665 [Volvox reticuliferus]GIM14061.1 hypothetical protein Vretimale_17091 [Volvox reticuliferus]
MHTLRVGGTELTQTARKASIACSIGRHLSRPGAILVPLTATAKCKPRSAKCKYRQGDEARFAASTAPNGPQPATAVPALAPQQRTARAQLKVIGLGLRGISAVNRLIGSETLPEAEFWVLDSDKRVLSTADATARVLEVGPGDDACLSPAELMALSGGLTTPPAQEAPDGNAGAVFVLGSAFGSPGGAPMLLQLVRHLRRQGYFVAAALTRPFEFEGTRRLEAADTLISIMEEVAHLVVVIAQGVLTRASADLTMSQAEAIADNTLVYTVQSTLWALRAPEVLKVSHGAFLWHGRDLRNIRRPLFPPMMSLLSCPGHATLGRGQAALPLPLLQQAGLASGLSTLAEDAVKAASESPFLDNKLESATAVLCILRVPPSALGVFPGGNTCPRSNSLGHGNPLVADNHKEYALRSSVQVAAMTVKELVGPHCHDIIVCPQLCPDLETDQDNGKSIAQLETAAPEKPVGVSGERNPVDATKADGTAAGRATVMDPKEQPRHAHLARVEVSLLVLERIEEAAEPKAIVGQKSSHDTPSNSCQTVADAIPSSVSPTAATARDRMTSVIGSRLPSVPRRMPTAGASTSAAGFFSGQLPQPTAAATVANPTGSVQPVWQGASIDTGTGVAGLPTPSSVTTSGTSATDQGSCGAAPSAAAAAAAAESIRARKQARLAAMSALAGGTPLGGAGGGSGNMAHGVAAVHTHGHVAGNAASAWGGGIYARGNSQQPQQQSNVQQPAISPTPAPPGGLANGGSGGSMFGVQIPRMAENLVTSLVAQSLDLPPRAARWRHQQRAPPYHARGAFQLPKVDIDPHETDENWLDGVAGNQDEGLGRGLQQLIMGMRLPGLASGDGGQPAGRAGGSTPVRNRVAGMLDIERRDLWDASIGGV